VPPIKTILQEKFIISVIVTDFVTQFTVFIEENSGQATNFVKIFGFI